MLHFFGNRNNLHVSVEALVMGVSRTSDPAFVVSFSGLIEMANWVMCTTTLWFSVLVSKENNELVNTPLFSHDPQPDCPPPHHDHLLQRESHFHEVTFPAAWRPPVFESSGCAFQKCCCCHGPLRELSSKVTNWQFSNMWEDSIHE